MLILKGNILTLFGKIMLHLFLCPTSIKIIESATYMVQLIMNTTIFSMALQYAHYKCHTWFFEFRIVLLLNWLLTTTREPSLLCYLIYKCQEKRTTHAFYTYSIVPFLLNITYRKQNIKQMTPILLVFYQNDKGTLITNNNSNYMFALYTHFVGKISVNIKKWYFFVIILEINLFFIISLFFYNIGNYFILNLVTFF